MTQNHRAVATAFMAQMNGGFNTTFAKGMDEPLTTVTNTGSQQQLT
jgi:DNA (cytosine-5)-methyltransferase 1